MKTTILAIAFISIFASCKNDPNKDTGKVNLLLPDSTGLNKNSNLTDTGAAAISKNQPAGNKANKTNNPNSGNASAGNSNTANTSNTGTATNEAPKKKGWSSAAKGAVIGAGAGAVAGAVIDNKHGEGAVIGAVVGVVQDIL